MRAGIARERLVVDPGIGFGKTDPAQSGAAREPEPVPWRSERRYCSAFAQEFHRRAERRVDPTERVPGSVAAALAGIMQGAQILRVHDVAATRQALTVWQAATNG